MTSFSATGSRLPAPGGASSPIAWKARFEKSHVSRPQRIAARGLTFGVEDRNDRECGGTRGI